LRAARQHRRCTPGLLAFFQGTECAHCAQQLRDLVDAGRAALGQQVAIVAVSSRKIDGPAGALRTLGVRPGDAFCLLVDEAHRAFRDFGCYDKEPLHGLFMLDRDGVIRARYTGEVPFNDPAAAIRLARRMGGND
jgi:peroxiredoxin